MSIKQVSSPSNYNDPKVLAYISEKVKLRTGLSNSTIPHYIHPKLPGDDDRSEPQSSTTGKSGSISASPVSANSNFLKPTISIQHRFRFNAGDDDDLSRTSASPARGSNHHSPYKKGRRRDASSDSVNSTAAVAPHSVVDKGSSSSEVSSSRLGGKELAVNTLESGTPRSLLHTLNVGGTPYTNKEDKIALHAEKIMGRVMDNVIGISASRNNDDGKLQPTITYSSSLIANMSLEQLANAASTASSSDLFHLAFDDDEDEDGSEGDMVDAPSGSHSASIISQPSKTSDRLRGSSVESRSSAAHDVHSRLRGSSDFGVVKGRQDRSESVEGGGPGKSLDVDRLEEEISAKNAELQRIEKAVAEKQSEISALLIYAEELETKIDTLSLDKSLTVILNKVKLNHGVSISKYFNRWRRSISPVNVKPESTLTNFKLLFLVQNIEEEWIHSVTGSIEFLDSLISRKLKKSGFSEWRRRISAPVTRSVGLSPSLLKKKYFFNDPPVYHIIEEEGITETKGTVRGVSENESVPPLSLLDPANPAAYVESNRGLSRDRKSSDEPISFSVEETATSPTNTAGTKPAELSPGSRVSELRARWESLSSKK